MGSVDTDSWRGAAWNGRRGLGLGIDVGGTYSDSVLVEMSNSTILCKAKSPTTHADLVRGIEQSLGLLDRKLFPEVQLVSLSTTLATNALVEGKRSRVVAILPGYKPETCPQGLGRHLYPVAGGHTAEGLEMCPLDVDRVIEIVESTRGHAQAYAISSYFSTRNPAHETLTTELVRKHSEGIPVVCGHDLSGKLNALRRATTTILNAHLIPIIRSLLRAVREVLTGHAIRAPLMVVKGDGSLMSEDMCSERPVETILSGPAASVVGASFLTGMSKNHGIVVDVGGTTSDIAILHEGRPKLNHRGVAVGPWQTHVAAVEVRTIGLGGDSHVWADATGKIRIGPKRVVPICFLGMHFPGLERRLESALADSTRDSRFTPTAFWVATANRPKSPTTAREEELLDALAREPLNIYQLARVLGTYPISIHEELLRLGERGYLRSSGFTPTDIFHVRGLYEEGNRDCSVLASKVLSNHFGMDSDSLLLKIKEMFNRTAALEIVEAMSSRPIPFVIKEKECPACREIWNNSFWERGLAEKKDRSGRFHFEVTVDDPIIGIGAPAHVLIPALAQRVNTIGLIPEHAEVANALGAIVGSIAIREEVLIRPRVGAGFVVFSSASKFECDAMDEALERARSFLEHHLRREVERAGGHEVQLSISEDWKKAHVASGKEMFIEVMLHGLAVSKPWIEHAPDGKVA